MVGISMVDSKELNPRSLGITFVILFLLGLLTFLNSFQNKFSMDDYAFQSTPLYSDIKYSSLQWNPYRESIYKGYQRAPGHDSYYRPLLHIVASYNYTFFKEDFWKYHLFNLCIFILAAFFLYLCILKISKNENLAFLSSALYIIHPINGVLVNYIVAASASFQVLFVSASILLLLVLIQNSYKRSYYFFSLLCFVIALLFYETSIMLPFYLGVVLLFADGLRKKNAILYLVPYFLIFFSYLLFRKFFISNGEDLFGNIAKFKMSIFEYGATIFKVLSWYVSNLFYPRDIIFMFASPVIRFNLVWLNLLLLASVFLFLVALYAFRKHKIIQIGLLWFLIGLLPAGLAMFYKSENAAVIEPHWFAFSAIGFFIFAAHCLLSLWVRMGKWVGGLVLIVIVSSWIQSSYAYNNLWRDEKTYTSYWVKLSPFLDFPRFNLAHAYLLEKNYDEAKRHFLLSLNEDGNDVLAFNNLGSIELMQNNFKSAEMYLLKSIKLQPSCVRCYTNLAVVNSKLDQWDKCEEYLLKALTINPVDSEALYNMAVVYIRNKDVRLKELTQTYITKVNNPKDLTAFANLMAKNLIFDIAYEAYIKALRLNPNDKDIYLGIGSFLGNQDRLDEAIQMWNFGLKIDPHEKLFSDNIQKALLLKQAKKDRN